MKKLLLLLFFYLFINVPSALAKSCPNAESEAYFGYKDAKKAYRSSDLSRCQRYAKKAYRHLSYAESCE